MSLTRFSNNSYPSRYNRSYNDDVFNDLFNWSNRQVVNTKTSQPSVNIKENEEGFVLELATPGVKKENLKLEINNDILTIASEVKQEKEETKENFSRREFSFQAFSRSFTLPDTVSGDSVKANYENGILTISIPKKEEAKPKPKVEIAIS